MSMYAKVSGAWQEIVDSARMYAKIAGVWQQIGTTFDDPSDIANLAIWLDMSDTSTITAPGGLRAISDKSGNGRNFSSPSSGESPASGSRTINGKNVLDFDGGDYLVGPTTPVASAETGVRWTVFIVHSDDNATDGRSILSQNFSSTLGQRRFQMYQSTNTNNPTQLVLKGESATSIIRAVHTAQPQISAMRWDGTAIGLRNIAAGDGTVGSSTGAPGTYSDAAEVGSKWKVGARTNGTTVDTVTGWHDGAIAEVIVYDRDLTDVEINQIIGYLREKWGI